MADQTPPSTCRSCTHWSSRVMRSVGLIGWDRMCMSPTSPNRSDYTSANDGCPAWEGRTK